LGYAEQGNSYYSTWCVVAICCLEYYKCLLQIKAAKWDYTRANTGWIRIRSTQ